MAIFFDAPVAPDSLTAFVRDVPNNPQFALSALFGTEFEDDNTVDFAEIVRTNRTARYRSYDGRIHVSERDAGSEKRVRLAPLSSSLGLGEFERLQLEFARNGGTNQARLAAAVYNDATQLTREVQARIEQAWGDVLTDGKLTINEEGFQNEADYGVPGSQIVAPAGALWSNTATSTPLTDIQTWVDVYVANNGFAPGAILTSQRMIRLMTKNTEIINAVYGATQGRTKVRLNELNDELSQDGFPTLLPAYDTQVDVDGTTTRVIPDDRVIFLPPNTRDLGVTKMGVTATALELVNAAKSDFSFQDAAGIVGVVIKNAEPPFRQFTYVDAVGMPVINGRLLMVADVA